MSVYTVKTETEQHLLAKLMEREEQVTTLTRERDEAREVNRKLIDATRVDCDVHFGARRECGQCYDSRGQYLKNVTAETLRYQAALGTAEARLDEVRAKLSELTTTWAKELTEARADAARKGEVLKGLVDHYEATAMGAQWAYARAALADTTSADWLAEQLAAQREACVAVLMRVAGTGSWEKAVRNTPLVNGSDSWLAERDAATRDAALEEAALDLGRYGTTWCRAAAVKVRALKRGGK